MMTIEPGTEAELRYRLFRMLCGDVEEFGVLTEAHVDILNDLVDNFVFNEELVTA
jgi:hypothetical protein